MLVLEKDFLLIEPLLSLNKSIFFNMNRKKIKSYIRFNIFCIKYIILKKQKKKFLKYVYTYQKKIFFNRMFLIAK